MDRVDVAVVGAGLVGAAVAYELASAGVSTLVLEAETEPAAGASRSNSGVVHTGFDSEPGTFETQMIRMQAVRWRSVFDSLGVPYRVPGALLVATDTDQASRLPELAENAARNRVEVELLDSSEAKRLEPRSTAEASLLVPGEAITDPYELVRRLLATGPEVRLSWPVERVEPDGEDVVVSGPAGKVSASFAVNCAGLYADEVAGDDTFRISARRGEFIVFGKGSADLVDHILLPVPTKRTKGALVFPTIYGHLCAGPSAVDQDDKLDRFAEEGMESLFDAPTAKRRRLPPSVRRLVVDLKAEYPAFNLNEIANIVHACFGRKPDYRSVARVLEEEPVPLKIARNYPSYHETRDVREARAAVVELRLSGWSAKAIAGYLGIHKATVHRTMKRWERGGLEGLGHRPFGRPAGVRKADFAAVEVIRKLAKNPGLGAFRVHAALAQMGFDLSRATCGRILARVREVYGYEKPEASDGTKRAMPFAASERHEVWSADVRHLDMVDEGLVGGKAYAVTVMDNYSRAILSSAVTRRQDLSAFLSVLYRAVACYGAPGMLVTDSGSVFLSNRARAVYAKLGVNKEEIEKGRPWQNYLETAFNVQRRMADWHFAKAESWPEPHRAHARWVEEYNAQYHAAYEKCADGKRSPAEVLGVLREARLLPTDLDRTFFAERYVRVLDAFVRVVWRRWKLYGEEALAGREAALWLREEALTVEHAGEPLSRYAVEFSATTGKPEGIAHQVLFGAAIASAQPRLFGLEVLGEGGWLKALKLEDYAPRKARPGSLQQSLFPYHEAWG